MSNEPKETTFEVGTFFIAGVKFRQKEDPRSIQLAEDIFSSADCPWELSLVAEPENAFDPNAVKVILDRGVLSLEDPIFLGYVPRTLSTQVAIALDDQLWEDDGSTTLRWVTAELIGYYPTEPPYKRFQVKVCTHETERT